MGLKRKRFRCGWRTLWVLAVCMVEIGRVRVKVGNAPIEQKISAYPPQADICAFVSTSLETKRAARRPSQGSGRPKCKREGVAEDRFGSSTDLTAPKFDFRFTPESGLKSDIGPCPFRANKRLMHRSNLIAYSITSSARESKAAGTARPSALAAWRLTMSSSFVGCSTGRSPGLAPRNILSMKVAERE